MQKSWLIHGSHASRVVQRKLNPARLRRSTPLRGPPYSPFTHCTPLRHSLHHFAITGLAPTILPRPDARMWRALWHSCLWLTAKARLSNFIFFFNCNDAKQIFFHFFLECEKGKGYCSLYSYIIEGIDSSVRVGHCIKVLAMLHSATALELTWHLVDICLFGSMPYKSICLAKLWMALADKEMAKSWNFVANQ